MYAYDASGFPLDGMDAGYGSGAHSRAFMRALGARTGHHAAAEYRMRFLDP